jgi:hypothetical protein
MCRKRKWQQLPFKAPRKHIHATINPHMLTYAHTHPRTSVLIHLQNHIHTHKYTHECKAPAHICNYPHLQHTHVHLVHIYPHLPMWAHIAHPSMSTCIYLHVSAHIHTFTCIHTYVHIAVCTHAHYNIWRTIGHNSKHCNKNWKRKHGFFPGNQDKLNICMPSKILRKYNSPESLLLWQMMCIVCAKHEIPLQDISKLRVRDIISKSQNLNSDLQTP